jgi:hypothetical protein
MKKHDRRAFALLLHIQLAASDIDAFFPKLRTFAPAGHIGDFPEDTVLNVDLTIEYRFLFHRNIGAWNMPAHN